MEELILEVHKRNVLWNRQHFRHKDRVTLDKEWNVIAKHTGFPSKYETFYFN